MRVHWLGHSCFVIEDSRGLRVLTDPYGPALGLPRPDTWVDVVTASHDHFDHFSLDGLRGDFTVVRARGETRARDVTFRGYRSFHDLQEGLLRGENTIYVFDVDGVTCAHLGDLGHVLTKDEAARLGPIDLLFVPVGGNYSLNARLANEVLEVVDAPFVVPMHYDIPGLIMPLGKVRKFLKGKRAVRTAPTLTIPEKPKRPRPREIVVLEPCFDPAPFGPRRGETE
ncbi:MAG: MBL fold metallo-hydrolase [Planctomycetes bacterium]|nr:MBL fold metallo-hydrolase [Planctomycetota bacterium]